MLRRSLIALAIAAPIALSGGAPASASAVTSTSAGAGTADTHCFLVRPYYPKDVIEYAKCRVNEIFQSEG